MTRAVPEYEISWQDTSGQQRFKNPLLLLFHQRARIPRSVNQSGTSGIAIIRHHQYVKTLPEWHRREELVGGRHAGRRSAKQNSGLPKTGMSELGLRQLREDAVRAVEKAIVNGQQQHILLLAMATVPVNPYRHRLMFRLISHGVSSASVHWSIVSLGERAQGV